MNGYNGVNSLGKTICSKFALYSIFKNIHLPILVKLLFIVNYFHIIKITVFGNLTQKYSCLSTKNRIYKWRNT